MDKLNEFEKNLKVAYLNYENNDLKETLKYLDRMLETLLKEDKSLESDPFWKTLSCEVFKAIVLNNFYNKVELTGNDLDSLLGNEEELKKNIKGFCDNFRNNELINFISHIENIADNPLKEVIKILMSNIEKMNITNIKTEKNINNDVIEVIDNQNLKTTSYDVNSDIENILAKENVSYFKDGKEVSEEHIIFAFSVIDRDEKSITIKTNPMCEVINGKINLNNPKTEFKLYKNLDLTLATPTMDRGYTYKISIKNQGNKQNFSSDELKEIMHHIHSNESDNTKNDEFNLEKNIENVFEIWNEIKNKNLELKDFFEQTEKESINELIYAKDKATIEGKKLSEYLKDDSLTCSDKSIQLIISYFGFQSLYDMNFANDGNIPCEEISVDNVGLFRAVLMINIIVKLDSIVSAGLPLNLKFTFERKEFAEILSPVLNYYLPKIFNNIKEIKILYK